ncbi:hypothetical protein BURPS668_A0674 [Burkholderia pseudomallei 668]|nr:hypothetical protein BURPS668_A0674 [Burkholderia pseudomallei 668]
MTRDRPNVAEEAPHASEQGRAGGIACRHGRAWLLAVRGAWRAA